MRKCFQNYKNAKKEPKKVVNSAKLDFYIKLGIDEVEKNMYKPYDRKLRKKN